MATLTQYPVNISLSRNLRDVIISSTEEVRFRLKKGTEYILDEKYVPDADGLVTIDIRDVVSSSLSLSIPTTDTFLQADASGDFNIYIGDSQSAAASFRAILGGIEGGAGAGTAEEWDTWLKANFLTWQSQDKDVSAGQPEWLTFYAARRCSLYAKFYNRDGTTNIVQLYDLSNSSNLYKVYTVNCTFQRLWALGATTVGGVEKERWGVIDVFLSDPVLPMGQYTYVQRYCYRPSRDLDEIYICANSLGGIDTFRFSGDRSFIPELEHTAATYDGRNRAAVTDTRRKWSQNTGTLTKPMSRNLWDLFRSLDAYHLRDGVITPIVLVSSEIKESAVETANAWTFEYRYAADDGLQNLPRTTDPASVPEIPGP